MASSDENQESEQDQRQEERPTRRRSGRQETEQQQRIIEPLIEGRAKYIEAVTQAYQDKQARIGQAWSGYTAETSEISFNVSKAWIDSYNDYVNEFARLPAQPDEEAIQAVQSAWTEHVKASRQSPDTIKAMSDAEHRLTTAIVEAEKVCQDAAHSAITEYTAAVDSALSACGLSNLDVEQAQFIASEIIARST